MDPYTNATICMYAWSHSIVPDVYLVNDSAVSAALIKLSDTIFWSTVFHMRFSEFCNSIDVFECGCVRAYAVVVLIYTFLFHSHQQ